MKAGLLSDVHANLTALEAVLAALPKVDELWVTGDTVGYGPEPSEVFALLRERGAHIVAGNHDLAVGTGQGVELFNHIAAQAALLHREWLSAEERDALAALPTTAKRADVSLVHGSLRDPIWEYVFEAKGALASLLLMKGTVCCNGHTHVPAIFRLVATESAAPKAVRDLPRHGIAYPLPEDGRALVNPGSVGQPRDGDPRAAWAVVDTGARTVTFGRTAYDVETTQRRMRERRLPEFLVERIALGL